MDDLFNTLLEAHRIASNLKDIQGRIIGVQLGICTQRMPDDIFCRIKATVAPLGAKTETDYLIRLSPGNGISCPVPNPGDTVLVMFADGDPHQGYYMGVLTNSLNPGADPDSLTVVNGNSTLVVAKDAIALQVGECTFKITEAGVFINDKAVTVVGGKDSRNDLLVQRGY